MNCIRFNEFNEFRNALSNEKFRFTSSHRQSSVTCDSSHCTNFTDSRHCKIEKNFSWHFQLLFGSGVPSGQSSDSCQDSDSWVVVVVERWLVAVAGRSFDEMSWMWLSGWGQAHSQNPKGTAYLNVNDAETTRLHEIWNECKTHAEHLINFWEAAAAIGNSIAIQALKFIRPGLICGEQCYNDWTIIRGEV